MSSHLSLLNLASGRSVTRGYDYYQNGHVISAIQFKDGTCDGSVKGQDLEPYLVHINPEHPRSCTCNCPFAEGRRVICKHMIALYFYANPQEVIRYRNACEESEREAAEWYEENGCDVDDSYLHPTTDDDQIGSTENYRKFQSIRSYVESLSEMELQVQLVAALIKLEELTSD